MSAYKTPPFQVTPSHLTLFFKHHKSTTALSLLATDSISHAKQQLLHALHSRNITTFPSTSIPLPQDPEDLEFGILSDKRDTNSGWIHAEDRSSLPKRKDKRSKPDDGDVETVGEWELKDGGYVAYRLKKSLEAQVDEAVEVGETEQWDVVVPAYDEEDEMEEDDIEIPRPRNQLAAR